MGRADARDGRAHRSNRGERESLFYCLWVAKRYMDTYNYNYNYKLPGLMSIDYFFDIEERGKVYFYVYGLLF